MSILLRPCRLVCINVTIDLPRNLFSFLRYSLKSFRRNNAVSLDYLNANFKGLTSEAIDFKAILLLFSANTAARTACSKVALIAGLKSAKSLGIEKRLG